MILYNMAYRGPYEYDKLVLNVFQYHNEATTLLQSINEENSNFKQEILNQLDNLSNNIHNMLQDISIRKELSSVK